MEGPTTDASEITTATRDDVGFLLAKASQRWNELLAERFEAAGFGEVRPAFGSVLLPLFEQDGLRIGELARRAHLSKQTMTEMTRRLESTGLVERRADPEDARAARIFLTRRSRDFEPVAGAVLADLERAVKRRLGTARADEVRRALRELLELG
jgi:DNA-binding MarR family transcriptional regulator